MTNTMQAWKKFFDDHIDLVRMNDFDQLIMEVLIMNDNPSNSLTTSGLKQVLEDAGIDFRPYLKLFDYNEVDILSDIKEVEQLAKKPSTDGLYGIRYQELPFIVAGDPARIIEHMSARPNIYVVKQLPGKYAYSDPDDVEYLICLKKDFTSLDDWMKMFDKQIDD